MPSKFYIGFIVLTIFMIFACVMSVVMPQQGWELNIQYIIIFGSVILWLLWLLEKREVKKEYGLSFSGIKKSRPWIYILVFLLIYFGRILLSAVFEKKFEETAAVVFNPNVILTILLLCTNFFLIFTAFLGEEYGWRYFLQPLLQKKFGLRGGIILLGMVWGLWHLPINIFYYSPETWLQSVINQQIVCIGYAVFFGYAYMKTKNIWVPVIIHFFNNNLVLLFTGTGDIGGYTLTWRDVLIQLILMIVSFGLFIFAPAFKKREQTAPSEDI